MLIASQGRIRRRTDLEPVVLRHGWQLLGTAPSQFATPGDVPAEAAWLDISDLAPVAQALQRRGEWSLDGVPRRFDAEDWWYRVRFDAPGPSYASPCLLGLDGLATVCEVWLNGEALLAESNMFKAHRLVLPAGLKSHGNELVIVCRSLDKDLAKRRPRPRWRAPMIENQQLRWPRTTVLGRTPGWSPPCAVVGPWRPVWWAAMPAVTWQNVSLQASAKSTDGAWQGHLKLAFAGLTVQGAQVRSASVSLRRGAEQHSAPLTTAHDGTWSTTMVVDSPALWWPHTHGEPALYEARVQLVLSEGAPAVELDLGSVGFRQLALDRSDGDFALHINGVPVFCRGACWTPLNPVTLDAAELDAYDRALVQVRDAGMNMVRVGGTMHYEADAFYDACDRLGVLVWQEFMFANMDYPEDPAWLDGVRTEVLQQLSRWQARPALAVLCGNSEVEQQAAMFGATRDKWAPALFHDTLAELSRAQCPDVPYWPSSAHGGSFPHQGDVGTTSYYGVGAYQRPLDDARRANLRFASECLALANVPENATLARMPGGLSLRSHHPAWKARAPRDLGAGWDFEDVRDHYLAQRFEVDPAKLRYSDHDRYLLLSRITSGELMAEAFAEWRREASSCNGALIWFLRDLWPGAGWGVVDSTGAPKAAYFGLKRSLQPISLSVTDEGGNGLYVHVSNEGPQPLSAKLQFKAWRHGQVAVGQASQHVDVPAHGHGSWPLMQLFDWFVDWSWAYRFGPATAQALSFELLSDDGVDGADAEVQGNAAQARVLARTTAFPAGWSLPMEADVGLSATVMGLTDGHSGCVEVRVATQRFAQSVHFDVDGYTPDDAYFHLAPGESRTITFTPDAGHAQPLSGTVAAVNGMAAAGIQRLGH